MMYTFIYTAASERQAAALRFGARQRRRAGLEELRGPRKRILCIYIYIYICIYVYVYVYV